MLKLLLTLMLAPALTAWQDAGPPEVDSQGRITFRLLAPDARKVMLVVEGHKPQEMHQDDGLWTRTSAPLEPDFYSYYFIVDGSPLPDPANPLRKPVITGGHGSIVHVPGPASLAWEESDAPRGSLQRITCHSNALDEDRELWVYTPPQYAADEGAKFPVLYLLHGAGDDAQGWTTAGRAHVILDNLIARGTARPMIVVMPLGYGFADPASNFRSRAFGGPQQQREIMDVFAGMITQEIIPLVESKYRVRADRDSRAIAGLSMGGSQALFIGLNHPDRFAYVGSFSGAFTMYGTELDSWFPNLAIARQEQLIWRSIGTEDFLLFSNRRFGEWIDQKQVKTTAVETPGGHTWNVFRRSLIDFAPLLFEDGAAETP